ncbi:2'-5' RNA ligase family protein [Nocardia sp. NPDC004068]|uniref:2'-5' RNA ligase family protein n=1 Tax=Nocardia sp. NPDC004068 TaxID=3364303 RepID=UPI003673D2D8
MVPPGGLHLTLVKVGDADMIDAEDLSACASAAEANLAALKPFSLEIGPLAGSPSAIRFSVAPWQPLVELHAALRGSITRTRPTQTPSPTAQFRPHLGIAYNNQRRPAAPVVKDVARLRHMPIVKVGIVEVKLVRLWRTEHHYKWQDRTAIALRP